MSRIGKQPITIPKGVEVKVNGDLVTVKGPKGVLELKLMKCILIKLDGDTLTVGIDTPGNNNFQGLYRSLIANMVEGTTNGFKKLLALVGVGYRAAVKGKALDMQLGFSHPTLLDIPEGLAVKVDKNTEITIEGMDKRIVGQFAAEVRSLRPPEPYKGKGVHYKGEWVRRKAGKAGKK